MQVGPQQQVELQVVQLQQRVMTLEQENKALSEAAKAAPAMALKPIHTHHPAASALHRKGSGMPLIPGSEPGTPSADSFRIPAVYRPSDAGASVVEGGGAKPVSATTDGPASGGSNPYMAGTQHWEESKKLQARLEMLK